MYIILTTFALAFYAGAFAPYTNFTTGSGVNSVNFSPDGLLLAACFASNTHLIYSFSTLQVVYNYSAGAQCRAVRFSPDQNYIAFGLQASKIVVMDASYNIISNITS